MLEAGTETGICGTGGFGEACAGVRELGLEPNHSIVERAHLAASVIELLSHLRELVVNVGAVVATHDDREFLWHHESIVLSVRRRAGPSDAALSDNICVTGHLEGTVALLGRKVAGPRKD